MARILVIEDNPDNLELMTYLLRAFGHSTLSAMNGLEGVAVACRERPDLIVCDVHMPKLDGYGVARELKRAPQAQGIPLIAVTALAMVGDRDKVLRAGFDGYVGKPIEPTTFVGDLEAFLGLPPSAPPAMPEHAPAVAPVEPHARVLVVDDSRNNRDLMEHTLGGFGYAVTLAKNVNDALALATQSPPDLILSDLHMPNEDGYAFLRAVKATPTLAAVPFVFISSSVWGDKDSLKALALGASRFILRPIEPTSLIREIASFLPRPR